MKAKLILFLAVIAIALSSCYSQRELTQREVDEYNMHIYRMKRYLCTQPVVDFDVEDFMEEYRGAKKIRRHSRVADSLYGVLCDEMTISL